MVYIVDDEQYIVDLLTMALQNNGIACRAFLNSRDFLKAMEESVPDVAILDWMMPPPDGEELCHIIRMDERMRNTHIIMLTALSSEATVIRALNAGADDYVVKPFSVRVICARVQAAFRKRKYLQPELANIISFADLVLDQARRMLSRQGKTIDLTTKEFDLLAILMRYRGHVLTRNRLLDEVWGHDYYGDIRTVDVHIRYLRQKIEYEPDHPHYIQTVRGVGYRFGE